jgi:hypothetical protein
LGAQEPFSEKYAKLRIYRVIYERNNQELDKLRDEFLKIKFESAEAKRLMAGGTVSNVEGGV